MNKLKLLFGLLIALPLLLRTPAGADDEVTAEQTAEQTTGQIEQVPEIVCETGTIVKVKGFPEGSLANEIATYTYNTYGLDYLLLLKAENGTFEPDRKHYGFVKRCIKGYNEQTQRRILGQVKDGKCYGKWKAMYDWGLCGFNEYWHPEIVRNYRFGDWKRQVDKCVELKKGGTVFYGRNGRYKYKNDFIFTEEQVCH